MRNAWNIYKIKDGPSLLVWIHVPLDAEKKQQADPDDVSWVAC
jgi:hypothetical protein